MRDMRVTPVAASIWITLLICLRISIHLKDAVVVTGALWHSQQHWPRGGFVIGTMNERGLALAGCALLSDRYGWDGRQYLSHRVRLR